MISSDDFSAPVVNPFVEVTETEYTYANIVAAEDFLDDDHAALTVGDDTDEEDGEVEGLVGPTPTDYKPKSTPSGFGPRALKKDPPEIKTLDTILQGERIKFFVRSWIQDNALVSVIGAPNSGKTTVVIDIICAAGVQDGQSFSMWKGQPIRKKKTLYIAGESVQSLGDRVIAWEKAYGCRVRDNIDVIDEAVPYKSSEEYWVKLSDEIVRKEYGVIVFDTHARMMVGLDENSSAETGHAVDILENLRKITKACIIVVHHTPKSGETGRGSSALLGALDTELMVRKELGEDNKPTNRLTVAITKQKNGPTDIEPMTLSIKSVDIRDVHPSSPETRPTTMLGAADSSFTIAVPSRQLDDEFDFVATTAPVIADASGVFTQDLHADLDVERAYVAPLPSAALQDLPPDREISQKIIMHIASFYDKTTGKVVMRGQFTSMAIFVSIKADYPGLNTATQAKLRQAVLNSTKRLVEGNYLEMDRRGTADKCLIAAAHVLKFEQIEGEKNFQDFAAQLLPQD